MKKIDIGWDELDIYVEGQLILNIGQTSDDKCINLYFYPKGKGGIFESELAKEAPEHGCTHELLVNREPKE